MRIEVPRGLTGDPAESTTTINSLSVWVDGALMLILFIHSFPLSFVRSFVRPSIAWRRKEVGLRCRGRPPSRVTEEDVAALPHFPTSRPRCGLSMRKDDEKTFSPWNLGTFPFR